MDPPTNLDELVDDLDVNIDELTTALTPLLTTPLRTQTSHLPLLDKAKLHILAALSIESILYSALLTAGIDAKTHPIFAELARLKKYNTKIKGMEEDAVARGPSMRLDKDAAGRFIRHGLAGNEKFDLERRERAAKERAIAAVRAARVNFKFDQKAEDEKQEELARKRKAEEMEREDGEEEEDSEDEEGEIEDEEEEDAVADADADKMDVDEEEFPEETTPPNNSTKKPRLSTSSSAADTFAPSSKKSKRRKSKNQATPTSTSTPATPTTPTASSSKSRRRRKAKKAKGSLRPEREFIPTEQEPPKTRSETFQALMDGSHAGQMRERAEEKARKAEEKAMRKAARKERVRY